MDKRQIPMGIPCTHRIEDMVDMKALNVWVGIRSGFSIRISMELNLDVFCAHWKIASNVDDDEFF